jgi:hypothetical protein
MIVIHSFLKQFPTPPHVLSAYLDFANYYFLMSTVVNIQGTVLQEVSNGGTAWRLAQGKSCKYADWNLSS